MTDPDNQTIADRAAPARTEAGAVAPASLAREAFFGRVSLDRMIDRFFDGEGAE